mmetsp:Transcript_47202/g.102742  ORF Transcript_47202/g.102742 Transcript_47202/m.102742 type:complete len:416 (+) Transcript_47202:75-1322(+)|eukprot:CAMPEP_0204265174 /NCGR_PEP_ID=MMETSP0468-20130131/9496_1 /ASSEMBLY_ACC=CAM_ASM_000383 /TAXON_ID=2969 /ORGANISM="Oxyrrhis marina" /LENGTH=415 /DNA_ID=CAMNT_0051240099 /DNA_START=22 /DNA_END=1269 /DNA_ORIENTATION=+
MRSSLVGLFAVAWATGLEEDDDIAGQSKALFTHAAGELHCPDRELVHPCVDRLKAWLDNKTDASADSALRCVRGVLNTSDDFFTLRNMTHLLLDLDVVQKVFDADERDGPFVMAGLDFGRKLIRNSECLADFDNLNDLQCRCPMLYNKILLLKLKNLNRTEEAQKLFQEAQALAYDGATPRSAGEAVPWTRMDHTPQIWLKGMRAMPVWPRDTWDALPICSKLEEYYPVIRREFDEVSKNSNNFQDAYRFLYLNGTWDRILLYHAKKFTPECEELFPEFCGLLKQWLPSKPGLPYVVDQNEQVMFLRMTAGTTVETHSGPSNNILNIHLGVSGDLPNARLFVAGEEHKWDEGKVIAWDGSFDHSVDCVHCQSDRNVLLVRYMHPDTTAEHFRGVPRTQFEEVPEDLAQPSEMLYE